MLKQLARLQHVIGDNVFQLLCDNQAPTTEIKAALSAFWQFIEQVEKNQAPATPPTEAPEAEQPPQSES
jgi:hypothetical protein